MKAICSHCKHKFSVPLEFAGEAVKCPNCKESVEAPELPASPLVNYILIGIISAALAGTIGFSCGALLTRTNREETKTKIAAIQAEADRKIKEAVVNLQDAEEEVLELKKELRRNEREVSELAKSTQKAWNQTQGFRRNEREVSELAKSTQKARNQTQEPTVSRNTPMFGVFLGETLDSLKKRFRVSQSTLSFEDRDHPGKIWSVQADNPNVKQLLVYTFDSNIYTIDIQFADGSRSNYEAIKSQLEKKYKSEDKGGISGAMFGEGVFELVIDGVEVKIKLNHDTGFMEDDKLELSYTHVPLSQKVYEEIQRRKAGKIGSEL